MSGDDKRFMMTARAHTFISAEAAVFSQLAATAIIANYRMESGVQHKCRAICIEKATHVA